MLERDVIVQLVSERIARYNAALSGLDLDDD